MHGNASCKEAGTDIAFMLRTKIQLHACIVLLPPSQEAHGFCSLTPRGCHTANFIEFAAAIYQIWVVKLSCFSFIFLFLQGAGGLDFSSFG